MFRNQRKKSNVYINENFLLVNSFTLHAEYSQVVKMQMLSLFLIFR